MKNVGGIDRILRILVGLIAIGFAVYLYLNPMLSVIPPAMTQLMPQATWLIVIGALGVVILLTGLLRFCLFYVPFGLSSCPVAPRQK
ncbi:MAG: DUF2892 domain-containing protein [Thiotrichaceae bacterium]